MVLSRLRSVGRRDVLCCVDYGYTTRGIILLLHSYKMIGIDDYPGTCSLVNPKAYLI